MFTGLVQKIGRVDRISRSSGWVGLCLDLGELAREVELGDSVAVSGVCLTATGIDGSQVTFDVVQETVSRTALSRLQPGHDVNIELALRLSDRLGGHLVSGHVDGVGRIAKLHKTPGELRMTVEAPPPVMRFLVEKGSVAIDGISLTVAALKTKSFEVALIPHTIAATTLTAARVGDQVNLEGDMIGRWVAKFLSGPAGIDSKNLEETLKKSGFFE